MEKGPEELMLIQTRNLAHPERFELPTLGSEDRCSIQLSYGCVREVVTLIERRLKPSVSENHG